MEDNNNMTLPLEEADNNITESPVSSVEYTDDNIRHLDDMEHIRVRSGMYIGRLGDGSQNDDGIYVLLKEETTACMKKKKNTNSPTRPKQEEISEEKNRS